MPPKEFDLLVVGELNVDILVTGDVVPAFGQAEQIVDGLSVTGGGSAAIMAAAASQLGLRVLFASIVGDDPFGRLLLQTMARAGVDTSLIVVDPAAETGATIHLLRGDGDRAMLTHLGSITQIGPGLVDPGWYACVRHLHLASPFLLSGLRPTMGAMAAAAHRQGATVSMDTNWDPAERWQVDDLLDETDILLPNEAEARALTGQSEIQAALDALAARVPVVALKQGALGATGAQGEQRVHVPAYDVDVRDATGAGDTFDAGFVTAWLSGATLSEALTFGSAAAALGTTAPGGFAGQPDWATTLALIAAQRPEAHAALAALDPARMRDGLPRA